MMQTLDDSQDENSIEATSSSTNTTSGNNSNMIRTLDDSQAENLIETTSSSTSTTSGSGQTFEVFVRKIPWHVTENELESLFIGFGEIVNFRFLKHKTGSMRAFAFITYSRKTDALDAIRILNGMAIRPGQHLDVSRANTNRRIFIGNIPKCKGKEALLEEFLKITPDIEDLIVYQAPDVINQKNRGFCFLEYETHFKASQALKTLLNHKPRRCFDCEYHVDWADEEEIPDDETMNKIKTVYVSNLSSNVSEEQLLAVFEICGKVKRIRKIKSFAFVHYYTRKDTEEAIATLNGKKLGGTNIKVTLARPPTRKAKREEILHNREIRSAQLMMGNPVTLNGALDAENEMPTNSNLNQNSPYGQVRGPGRFPRYPTTSQADDSSSWRNMNNSGFGDQIDQMQNRRANLDQSTVPTYFGDNNHRNAGAAMREEPLPGFPFFVPRNSAQ